jgi:hypothetical protein
MSDFGLKIKLLGILKSQQKEAVINLKAVMEDAQKTANDYGAPRDRYDSFRMQLLRKKDMFAQQLAKVIEQADVLEKISNEIKLNKVEFGALVITDKQNIFVSIGIGKIEVDGEDFFAISPNVPIYKSMAGMCEADEFEFRKEKIKILSIY